MKQKFPYLLLSLLPQITPVRTKKYSGNPVHIVISGRNIRRDWIIVYNEIDGSEGGLGRIKGDDFNCALLDYLEATENQGN